MEKPSSIILGKMLAEINLIEEFVQGYTLEEFLTDDKTKSAVVMRLLNMGELGIALKRAHPEYTTLLPLDEMIGLRHHAAHGYGSIKFNLIWNIISIELPSIESQIKSLINKD